MNQARQDVTAPLPYLFAAGLLAAALITAWVYWPGLSGGYLLDDYSNIVGNPALAADSITIDTLADAGTSVPTGIFYRPVAFASFLAGNVWFGESPFVMKATNLAIHITNGGLVYILVLLALRLRYAVLPEDPPELSLRFTALAVATAWMLLPINLTAVLYIVQRMTSLSASFTLAALIFYVLARLRGLNGDRMWPYLLAGFVPCTLLAVLTKENGVLAPLYALVIEFVLVGFRNAQGNPARKLIGFFLAFLVVPAIAGLAFAVQGGWFSAHRDFTLIERVLTEFRVVLDYIVWTLLPSLRELSFYHDDYTISRGLLAPPTTILSMLAVIFLVSAGVLLRRRYPLLSLGILWYFAGHSLESTVFPLELVFEHRNYLPSIGLLIAVFGTLILEVRREKLVKPSRIAAVLLVAIYGILTAFRAQLWSSPLNMAAYAAESRPGSAAASYEKGRVLANYIDRPGSDIEPLAFEALERARSFESQSLLPDVALINLSATVGKAPEKTWIDYIVHHLDTRMLTASDNAALTSLLRCVMTKPACLVSATQMDAIFEAAFGNSTLANRPRVLVEYANYVLRHRRDTERARALVAEAVSMKPDDLEYRANLASLHITAGDFTAAELELRELRKRDIFGRHERALTELESLIPDAGSATERISPQPYKVRLAHEVQGQAQ